MSDNKTDAKPAPFGTVFGPHLPVARFDGNTWSAAEVVPTESLTFGVATHSLHYGSECFEGMKAHRQEDGSIRDFRADVNIQRLRKSAEALCLPVPSTELLEEMVTMAIEANVAAVPDPPGSLYLRPNILGTDLNIGAASRPSKSAVLYVLTSPVGAYLPPHMLRVKVDSDTPRTTPQFGRVKCGSNYAMALGVIQKAAAEFNADQVLFAPGGYIEETGAANFMLLEEGHIITAPLSDSFLHGVTRDSLLQLARSLDWKVEERPVNVSELQQWCARPNAEAALAGTAAILGGVGTIIIGGEDHLVGAGETGPATKTLRNMLTEIQVGKREFSFQ
ncbi:MAG: branched-chain-amino-acid transaminase [Myxococcales bacterium]|nr:branched-chain-amino-acid transaminase [Myxococcales bacterium]